MHRYRPAVLVLLVMFLFGSALPAHAAMSDAVKCEATRLKLAGKYADCTLKTKANALLKQTTADLAPCAAKYDATCGKIAAKYGAECPMPADCASIRDLAECASESLPLPSGPVTTNAMGN